VIEHTFYRNGIPLNFPDVKRKKTVPPFVPGEGTGGDGAEKLEVG
jgi:hypothetical protein